MLPDTTMSLIRQSIHMTITNTTLPHKHSPLIQHFPQPLRKDQTMSMRQNMREIISRTMRRPVPLSTGLPPTLQLKSRKHRALTCRWHLGVFPVHYRYLPNIGLHIYLDDLRSLSQKNVSNLELRKIRIAHTVVSSIPELYCLTAL